MRARAGVPGARLLAAGQPAALRDEVAAFLQA
jgi:hypothetical protein